jgi:hypothetical protein
MASSLTGGRASPRMQATVLRMPRDGVGRSATPRGQVVSGPDGPGNRRTSFDDVVVVLCLFALIGLGVVGGVVILLAWVTAILPVSPRIACPEFDGCVVPGPAGNPDLSVDDYRTDGLIPTRERAD